MSYQKQLSRYSWVLIMVLLQCACAPKVETRQRYFFPIGDPEPKIEYIDFYQADRDVTAGSESHLKEVVLGAEKPENLFVRPHDVASNGKGRVAVSDLGKSQVVILDLEGARFRTLKPSVGEDFYQAPFGLAMDERGWLYVTDIVVGEVFVFDENESLVNRFGDETLTRPTAVAVDLKRERIGVVDTGAHRVRMFDLDGEHLFDIGVQGAGPGQFNRPLDLAIDDDGTLFVLDALNARVQVFDADGLFLRQFGERGTASGSFQMAKNIALDGSGHIYVTDALAHKMVIFDRQGVYLLTIGGHFVLSGTEVSPGGLNMPAGIDIDGNDAIWVVDSLNRMVHRFQFLNSDFLQANPILPGQSYLLPEFNSQAPSQ